MYTRDTPPLLLLLVVMMMGHCLATLSGTNAGEITRGADGRVTTSGPERSLLDDCEAVTKIYGTLGKPIEEFTTCEDFKANFFTIKPGILRRKNQGERLDLRRERFLRAVDGAELAKSDLFILLGTANSYTGREFKNATLGAHVGSILRREEDEAVGGCASRRRSEPWKVHGNETYYLFGNHVGKQWDDFLAGYPPVQTREEFACAFEGADENQHFTMSFGVSGRYEGVPFHHHGHGFLDVLIGGKKWLTFLDRPNNNDALAAFDPNITSSHFYLTSPPSLLAEFYEANLWAGDVIYFPPRWPHATLNLDVYNVWISTFA